MVAPTITPSKVDNRCNTADSFDGEETRLVRNPTWNASSHATPNAGANMPQQVTRCTGLGGGTPCAWGTFVGVSSEPDSANESVGANANNPSLATVAAHDCGNISNSTPRRRRSRICFQSSCSANNSNHHHPSFFDRCKTIAAISVVMIGIFHSLHTSFYESYGINEANQTRLQQKHHHSYSEQSDQITSPDSTGDAWRRRRLWSLSNFLDPKSVQLKKPFGASDVHANSRMAEQDTMPNLSPYGLDNVRMTPPAFLRELFILYYDPSEDQFRVYINEGKDEYMSQVWSPVWSRLNTVMPPLAFALRKQFSDRFRGAAGGSAEFLVLVSTGDVPKLACECVRAEERMKRPNFCRTGEFAPILQFGSVYRDSAILPNVVTMPVWTHMPCFQEWQREKRVCDEFTMRRDVAGVLGGEETIEASANGLRQMPFSTWDALAPTLIWRGSDYIFLKCIYPQMHSAEWDFDIAPQLSKFGNHARGVVQSLLDMWDNLTPRWKGAALSAIAALDAQEISAETGANQIPWIDAKFTVKSKVHGNQVSGVHDRYEPFREYGIQMTGEPMSLSQLSRYRYHIDLGGGGGTTWFGTMEKLGMPGVLLHHVASAKDYYHDDLIPWVHYIPLNEDLSNLKEMYDWAEANSDEAQKISDAGTKYVKSLAKPRVMKAMYQRYFVRSLKSVIDAYRPVEGDEALTQMKNFLSRFALVGRCSGREERCKLKPWKIKGENEG